MGSLEELGKWLITFVSGGGMVSITLFMAKKFYEKNIVEAIEEAKEASKSAQSAVSKAQEAIRSLESHLSEALTKVYQNQNQLNSTVTRELSVMGELFAKATDSAAKAIHNAETVNLKINHLENVTNENIRKLARTGMKLARKVDRVETEIAEIAKNTFRVSTKK